MALKSIQYIDARPLMKAGDVIAFAGKSHFSEIIKWATNAPVSHVGIILQTQMIIDGESQPGMFNQIIESAQIDGFTGVIISRLSERLKAYKGEIWWLPLRKDIREKMDKKKFYDFLIHQEHKKYDMPQAIKAAIDASDKIPFIGDATQNTEDFSRFFCSELVTAGLDVSGAIDSINSSEVTPIDLCSFNLFENDYYQLKGNRKEIENFNSIDPEGWGE